MNCQAHLGLLEACRKHAPGAKIVFTGTRQQYGRPEYLPVEERHPLRPIDVNGIHKVAGEAYHLLYGRLYGLRTASLRLTNTYGPGQLMRHSRQAFVGWLIRRALDGEQIPELFGDGRQMRDFTYVDDVVDALLVAAHRPAADGEVFNLSGERPYSLREFADILVAVVGRGSYVCVPFPEDRSQIDIGSYYADSSKIKAYALGARGAAGRRPAVDSRVLPTHRERLLVRTVVPFLDLRTQYHQLKTQIDRTIQDVLDSDVFLFGRPSRSLRVGVRRISRRPPRGGGNSDTEALRLAMLTAVVGPGDDVLTSAMTAVATVVAIEGVGARAVLVDIDPATYTLDVSQVEARLTRQTKAIIPYPPLRPSN